MHVASRKFVIVILLMLGLGCTTAATVRADDGGDVAAGDNEKLGAKNAANGKPLKGKTVARHSRLCKALLRASSDRKAGKLGKKNQWDTGRKGKLKFFAHDEWMARLLCSYMDGVNSGEFAKSYQKRQAFVRQVLKALENKARPPAALVKTSTWVDSANLRVGAKLYGIRRVENDKGRVRLIPKARSTMWIARSYEQPSRFLMAVNAKYFRATVAKPKPLDLIRAAEHLIFRIYVLAKAGEMTHRDGHDRPRSSISKNLLAATVAFRKAVLPNTKKPPWEEGEKQAWFAAKAKKPAKPQAPAANARNTNSWLELRLDPALSKTINDQRVGKKAERAAGIRLFVYRPLARLQRGPNNQRDWFLKRNAGASASGGEAEGIMLPFEYFKPTSWSNYLPESVVDETTKIKVITRFEIWGTAVARVFYFAQSEGQKVSTSDIFTHELRHFQIYRSAWHDHIAMKGGKLDEALKRLTGKINNDLGLSGEEAFRYDGVDEVEAPWSFNSVGPWRMPTGAKGLDIRDMGLFEGWIKKGQWLRPSGASALKPNLVVRPISFVRLRLTRMAQSERSIVEVIEKLKSRRDNIEFADEKFLPASEHWSSWKGKEFRAIKNGFYGTFLRGELALDMREGQITSSGLQGRPELASHIKLLEILLLPADKRGKNYSRKIKSIIRKVDRIARNRKKKTGRNLTPNEILRIIRAVTSR